MPLYDYQCEGCKRIYEIFAPYESRKLDSSCCPNHQLSRIISAAKLDVFKPAHFEELGDDTPYIESKQQLAEECQKRGLRSVYLEGSYNSRRPARWL